MSLGGIRFGAEITAAAAKHALEPALLAAVAAQETGGPGSNSGSNVVGTDGHGRGLFQIDDRSWAFARTPAAMNPARNADMAASILQANLQRYGGDVHKALSAYNTGAPNAAGTRTTWADGRTLGYADSVLRHYAAITREARSQAVDDGRDTSASVNALATLGETRPCSPAPAPPARVAASAPALAGVMPQLTLAQQPAPLPLVPAAPGGSQAQAASAIGARADADIADLLDQGNLDDTTDAQG